MSNDKGAESSNLRTRFRDYYADAKQVHKGLIENAIYVLDTNVLLNMYRIPKSSRERLLGDLQAKSDRVWMPFQVALELHRNCDNVRSAQTKSHSDRIKSINEFVKTMSSNGKSTRLESSPEQQAALQALNTWKAKLEKENEAIREEINHQKPDEVLEWIADIFADSIGAEPSAEDYKQLHKDADERYSKDIPPGYADRDKPDGRGYGDYIAWKQTLEYAKAASTDVVFVTDDSKEDWKVRLNSKALRARPELIVEFQAVTGQDISIVNSDTFFYEISSAESSEESKEARKDLSQVVRDEDERNAFLLDTLTQLNTGISDRINSDLPYGERLADHRLEELDIKYGLPASDIDSTNMLKIKMLEAQLRIAEKRLQETEARLESSWSMLKTVKREDDPSVIAAANSALKDLMQIKLRQTKKIDSILEQITEARKLPHF